MLKKNQVLLILLTLVLMLSVYFISSPFEEKGDDNNDDDDNIVDTTGRLEELSALRVSLNDERTVMVLSLDAVIADNNSTVDQKNKAIEDKKYLNSLTEKELLLEVSIINKGYRDCFVHASESGIEIIVVSETSSVTLANEIIKLAMNGFGDSFDDVFVSFQTAQQVMASVA